MFLKSLSKYQPVNLLIFILLGFIFWLKTFINSDTPGILNDSNPMPFYLWIVQNIGSIHFAFITKGIAFILVLLQGLLIIGVINQYNLIGMRSYLPGIIYLMVASNFPEYQQLTPVLISLTFLLLAWNQLIVADFAAKTYGPFFNASVFIGISTLFYPNFIYFVIIFLLSTFLNRMATKRELGMLLGGIIVVWYFYLVLFFIFTNKFELSGIETDLSFSSVEFGRITVTQKIFFIFFGILIIISSIKSTRALANQKIQLRRNQKFLFLWFVVTLLIFSFTKSSFELIYLIAVPTSVLLSLFFSDKRYRWIKEIAFLLMLTITIINQFLPNLLV